MSISIDEFSKAEIRVGKVVMVEDIPTARKPMYKMTVDFGGFTRQCVGGIKEFYSKDQMQGRQVVAVVNLEPKSVAGVTSECMLLAAFDETMVSLLAPDRELPLGTKVG
ncbi:MAG: tRNA-binding protein [Thaumarchaeota archaeon]|nr:tRNA-binding protein [Nitrososphaerota archaeon]